MQVKCNNLTLAYEGKAVVKDLTFSVSKGDYLCILGENGSGKSTLIKALLGLKKPQRGEIVFGDKNAKIGYLPQQTPAQKDFPASVKEIVLSGCLNHCGLFPFYNKELKKRAEQAMAKLNITDLAKKSYRNLSGGQQQRVLLARALCAAEDLLLLDEPVTGLDPMATRDMYECIREINARGTTVIMVSHDVKQASRQASHVLHLHEGHHFFGSKEEYAQSGVYRHFKGGIGL